MVDDARDAENPPLAEQFRQHFGHREHLYGRMLDVLADDLDAGGMTAAICRDQLTAGRGDAVQLRLLAGIQRVVLSGDAPDLATYYAPDATLPTREDLVTALRPVLAAHEEELRAALLQAPQTNEVGRSACLVIALFEAVRRHGLRRIRLLEPGASAGLNLNVDRYRFTGVGWSFGPEDSPLVLDTEAAGIGPEEFTVVQRRGCDLAPVDVTDPERARYLTSFVWPFDTTRRQRLAAAIEIQRQHPVVVDRAPASAWVTERLGESVDGDVLTVIWQSITRQYWPASESDAVDRAVEEARDRIPICQVSMEGVPPVQRASGFDLVREGPELRVDGDVIAHSHHHGPPVIPLL